MSAFMAPGGTLTGDGRHFDDFDVAFCIFLYGDVETL